MTEEIPGQALDLALAEHCAHDLASAIEQVERCLRRIHDCKSLLSVLDRHFLEVNWDGPHGRDFCPQRWLAEHDTEFSRIVDNLGRLPRWPLLGSVTTNNILVREANDTGMVIGAFLDMEGSRLGPAGFDQALVWYDLMFDGRMGVADRWLDRILRSGDSIAVAGTLTNAAWLCAYRSRVEHAEQARDEVLRRTVRERLLEATRAVAGYFRLA